MTEVAKTVPPDINALELEESLPFNAEKETTNPQLNNKSVFPALLEITANLKPLSLLKLVKQVIFALTLA